MDTKYKSSDAVLEQIVIARREEVVQLQIAQANQLKEIEIQSQARFERLQATLPKDLYAVLQGLDKAHEDETAATQARVDQLKSGLVNARLSQQSEIIVHPGLAGGQLLTASAVGWFAPYYGVLHWPDGTVVWQGYNPGTIDLVVNSIGAGNGLFGTGAAEYTLIMDWYYTYTPPESRYYSYTIYVPYNGFYILYANDGFWDSKHAQVRMDLTAQGYQSGYWKAPTTTNVFALGGQNINQSGRFDGVRQIYHADLLGGNTPAYLRVSASYNTYARGGGSTALLDFNDGAANFMGTPWVYVV